MKKRLVGLFLGVAFLFQGNFAFSQFPSGGPLPEPIPLGASGPAQGMPQSFGPMMAGMPSDGQEDLSISSRAPSAFMEEPYIFESTYYGSVGARALMRQNPISLQVTTPGPTLPGQNFNGINPVMAWGPQVTLGYIFNNHMFEFYGFYIPQNSKQISSYAPGQVSSPFGATGAPAGFAGLFQNASSITTTLNDAVGNVEFNYRRASNAIKDFEFLFGLRYFNMFENMIVGTDANQTSLGANPALEANYYTRTNNNLLGLQMGYEHNMRVLKHLGIGSFAKGSAGVNWWDSNVSLVRGDKLVGFQGGQNGTTFGSVVEIALYADFLLLERCRMRAGYNVLWAFGVSEASQQFNYNFSQTNGSNQIGTTFFGGPSLDFQFLF
jgi:hypothetical protein